MNDVPLGLGTAQLGNLGRAIPDEEAAESIDCVWELRIRPADQTRRWDFSRDAILRSLEASVDRTGLDRFDTLYLHDPDDYFEQASTEGMSTRVELREQGVVGSVGAGTNSAAPLAELIRRADIDVVMCAGRFTLLDDSAEADLLPLALSRRVSVVVAGVFNSGLLSTPNPSQGATFNYSPAGNDVLKRATAVASVCAANGERLPAAAIAYVRRHPAVGEVVVGARGRLQVAETVKRASEFVPESLWRELADAGLISETAW